MGLYKISTFVPCLLQNIQPVCNLRLKAIAMGSSAFFDSVYAAIKQFTGRYWCVVGRRFAQSASMSYHSGRCLFLPHSLCWGCTLVITTVCDCVGTWGGGSKDRSN